MTARLRLWRGEIRKHPFIATGIILALLALIVLIIAVVLSNGTGFTGYTVKSTTTEITLSPQTKVTTTAQSQPGKTLWDLSQLLAALAIPVIVGFGVAWFTTQQARVSERENKDNQREKALQDYIDNMSELLLEQNLRESKPEDEVRKIARVRTLTVLRGLDGVRKGSVLQFLYESGLIDKDESIVDLHEANLSEAHLLSADLNRAHLNRARLSEAKLNKANLSEADLSKADLSGINLSGANLNKANLNKAKLNKASLSEADLSEADLSEADLSEAKLNKANLSFTNLSFTILCEANLSGAELNRVDMTRAILKGAIGIIIEDLEKKAKSLKNTTMPNGVIHR